MRQKKPVQHGHNYTQLWDTSFALIIVSFNQHWSQHWIPFPKPYSFEGNPCNMDGNSMQIHPYPSVWIRSQKNPSIPAIPCSKKYIIQIWDDLGCSLFFFLFFPLIFHGILQIPHRFKAAIAEAGAVPHLAALLKDPKAQVTAAGALRNLAAQNVANQEPFEETLPKGLKRRQLYDFVCYIDDNLIYIIFVLFTSVVLFFM